MSPNIAVFLIATFLHILVAVAATLNCDFNCPQSTSTFTTTTTISPATPATPPPTTTTAAAFYPNGRDRPHKYQIISDEIRFLGWRKVIRRSVLSPVLRSNTLHKQNQQIYAKHKIIEYDIIDQTHATGGAVIIFAWNSTSKSCTIVREYSEYKKCSQPPYLQLYFILFVYILFVCLFIVVLT